MEDHRIKSTLFGNEPLHGKTNICIGENKGADQLSSNCKADQRLCFRYTDSTIPLLSKSKISSLLPSSVTVQPGLCRISLEPNFLDFLRTGSNIFCFPVIAHISIQLPTIACSFVYFHISSLSTQCQSCQD